MALLKSDIIDRVRTNLDDEGVGTYFSDEDINDALVDIYDDIVCQSLPFEKSVSINYTENKVFYNLYNSVTDYIFPIAIYDNNASNWVKQRTVRYLEGQNSRWKESTGNPQHFTVIDYRYIAFYPHPATTAGSFTLYYKYRVAEPDLADTINISKHNDTMLIDGITSELLAQEHEFTKARGYYQDYIKSVIQERTLTEGRISPDRLFRLGANVPG